MVLRLPLNVARFILVCSFVGLYFFFALLLLPLIKLNPPLGRKAVARLIQMIAAIILRVLRVEHTIEGEIEKHKSAKNYFLIANHMSYLDVLILAQYFPASFVTSVEVKETPVLGQICVLAGCLFVERRSRDNLHREVSDITTALKHGNNVLVFPEATSTNGETVIRFKRPLFQAAIDSEVRVLPLSLRYEQVDHEDFSAANRDKVCWYGDMDFLPHFWSLHQLRSVRAKVFIHPPEKAVAFKGPADLAEYCQSIIKKTYLAGTLTLRREDSQKPE